MNPSRQYRTWTHCHVCRIPHDGLHLETCYVGKMEDEIDRLSVYVSRVAEVRLNDDKTLDEVVTKDGDQLEQMDFNHWFLQIGDVAVWLHSKNAIRATYERRATRPISPERKSTPMSLRAFGSPDALGNYCINKAHKEKCTEWKIAYDLLYPD